MLSQLSTQFLQGRRKLRTWLLSVRKVTICLLSVSLQDAMRHCNTCSSHTHILVNTCSSHTHILVNTCSSHTHILVNTCSSHTHILFDVRVYIPGYLMKQHAEDCNHPLPASMHQSSYQCASHVGAAYRK
jgi:hypothetical protein